MGVGVVRGAVAVGVCLLRVVDCVCVILIVIVPPSCMYLSTNDSCVWVSWVRVASRVSDVCCSASCPVGEKQPNERLVSVRSGD